MKVALLSDQHGTLPEIPVCDLLIIAGDICGGPDYIDGKWRPDISDEYWYKWLETSFANWILKVPKSIVIAGNHDTTIEKYGFPNIPNVTYLCNSGCSIEKLNIWGCPYIPRFDNLAFNKDEQELDFIYRSIPRKTNLLISHAPPFRRCDLVNGKNVGSTALRTMIDNYGPRILVCGHIHESYGVYLSNRITIINTACKFTVVNIDEHVWN